jgi:hypothetical protein
MSMNSAGRALTPVLPAFFFCDNKVNSLAHNPWALQNMRIGPTVHWLNFGDVA